MDNRIERKSAREQILERMPEEIRLAYEAMENDSRLRNKIYSLPITTYKLSRE